MENEENPSPQNFLQMLGILSKPDPNLEQRLYASRHEMRSFLLGLDSEQLLRLGELVSTIQSMPASADFYLGLIIARLEWQDNICLACGKDHDKEIGDLIDTSPKDEPPKGEPKLVPPVSTDSQKDDTEDLLELFEMKYTKDGTLVCKNCESPSPSMEDRMRRRPGKPGCDNCTHKEKWG